jgi:hypothetical protein
MALRELRHPFGQAAWAPPAPPPQRRNGAPAQSTSVTQLPAPQQVGWPERAEPRARRPHEELADIIGSGSGAADERAVRAFFAEQAMRAEVDREVDAWSIAPPPPMSKGNRRAMYATIAMFVLGTFLIGGQLVYHRVLMPVPIELGQGGLHRVPAPAPQPPPPPAVPPLPMDPAPRPPASDALSALAPDEAGSLVELAWLQIRAGDAQKAHVYAQRATAADPSDEKTWAVLERTLEALRDPKLKHDAYRRCVSASPSPFGFACSRLLK